MSPNRIGVSSVSAATVRNVSTVDPAVRVVSAEKPSPIPHTAASRTRDEQHDADQDAMPGVPSSGEGEREERQARDEERARGGPGGEQLPGGDLGGRQERDLQGGERAGVAVAVDRRSTRASG